LQKESNKRILEEGAGVIKTNAVVVHPSPEPPKAGAEETMAVVPVGL